jgi:predicted nucleic acid-binding protein
MLLDTSAWVEYFIGSVVGRRVKEVLEKEECYTSLVTIAEITNWALRERKNASSMIDTIEEISNLIEPDEDITVLAGRLNYERKKKNKKWGMMDSFILATGMIYDMRILTKDPDFDDLDNVELLI